MEPPSEAFKVATRQPYLKAAALEDKIRKAKAALRERVERLTEPPSADGVLEALRARARKIEGEQARRHLGPDANNFFNPWYKIRDLRLQDCFPSKKCQY
jgi:hypothetical protein